MSTGRLWLVRAATLAGLVAGGPTRAGLVTSVDSSLSLTAEAEAGFDPMRTSTDSQSQGATIDPLSVSVQASSSYASQSVTVGGGGAVTWSDPAHAHLVFSEIGFTAVMDTGVADVFTSPGWVYSFISNVNGSFALNYNVAAHGSYPDQPPLVFFGLNDSFLVYAGPSSIFPNNPANLATGPNGSGVLTVPVTAGTAYTVQVMPFVNIEQGIGTRDAHVTGSFDFSVQATPAPRSLVSAAFLALAALGWRWVYRPRAAL